MKVTLEHALTGTALRNNIFNVIASRPLHSLSTLLKRSRQRDSSYLPYSSQHNLTHAESPIRRADLSNPLTASPPAQYGHPTEQRREQAAGVGVKAQRIRGKRTDSSKPKKKSNHKSAPKQPTDFNSASRDPSKGPSHSSHSPSKSRKDPSSRGKSGESSKFRSTSSKRSPKNKLDLSSIIENSRERVTTPPSRGHSHKDKSRRSAEKTRKKTHREELPESVCRRVARLCKDSSRFVRVMRGQVVSVRMRVQRRRIIELEVLTHKAVERLTVMLERGNLDCQHIQEKYVQLSAGSRLALFSCVRTLDIDRPAALPRLHIEAVLQEGVLLDRHLTLPYSWLHFATEGRQQAKSRIVTKACLEGVWIDVQRLRALGQALPGWTSRHSRGESLLCSQFSVGDEGFSFVGRQTDGVWSLEVVGRGQTRLQGLLSFLSAFLRPC